MKLLGMDPSCANIAIPLPHLPLPYPPLLIDSSFRVVLQETVCQAFVYTFAGRCRQRTVVKTIDGLDEPRPSSGGSRPFGGQYSRLLRYNRGV